jgi:hypothetical protein
LPLQSQTLDFSELRGDVDALDRAIANTDDTLPGHANATAAIGVLNLELPNVQTAFMEIQNNADVEDFSPTLDIIDTVEVAR